MSFDFIHASTLYAAWNTFSANMPSVTEKLNPDPKIFEIFHYNKYIWGMEED